MHNGRTSCLINVPPELCTEEELNSFFFSFNVYNNEGKQPLSSHYLVVVCVK